MLNTPTHIWSRTERAELVEQTHIQGLYHSLSHMPDGTYKTYNHWLLAHPDYSQRWMQLMGLRATAMMTDEVLEGHLTADQLKLLVPYGVPMTMMLTYEVASDNIAIYIANYANHDHTLQDRLTLLHAFNDATITRLKGDPRTMTELLAPVRPLAQSISSFRQSLSCAKFEALRDVYLQAHPQAHPQIAHDIEFSLFEILIANAESGIDTLQTLDGYILQDFVRQGLIQRYQGSDFLLRHRDITWEQLISASTDSIMVVPTLAYYIAHIVEKIDPRPQFQTLLDDGTLLEALEVTALLVRILNDIGTDVLEYTLQQRGAFIAELYHAQSLHHYQDFTSLITDVVQQKNVAYTRLKKDLTFGEYNIALHHARLQVTAEQAIATFNESLQKVVDLYVTKLHQLSQLSDKIGSTLNSPSVSRLLNRFVVYHQHFYRNSFETNMGEYGI